MEGAGRRGDWLARLSVEVCGGDGWSSVAGLALFHTAVSCLADVRGQTLKHGLAKVCGAGHCHYNVACQQTERSAFELYNLFCGPLVTLLGVIQEHRLPCVATSRCMLSASFDHYCKCSAAADFADVGVAPCATCKHPNRHASCSVCYASVLDESSSQRTTTIS